MGKDTGYILGLGVNGGRSCGMGVGRYAEDSWEILGMEGEADRGGPDWWAQSSPLVPSSQ